MRCSRVGKRVLFFSKGASMPMCVLAESDNRRPSSATSVLPPARPYSPYYRLFLEHKCGQQPPPIQGQGRGAAARIFSFSRPAREPGVA